MNKGDEVEDRTDKKRGRGEILDVHRDRLTIRWNKGDQRPDMRRQWEVVYYGMRGSR